MKKSGKIELVLLTALLTGCSRTLVPAPAHTVFPEDSSLTAMPAARDATCDPCQQAILSQAWNNSLGYSWPYLRGILPGGYYYPGQVYRKGAVWKNPHLVIIRGGFGKTWFQSASS